MRIVAHHSKYYDWEAVPADVKVTEADVKAERVKPSGNGGWVMKVTRDKSSFTTILIPEKQVVAKIIDEKTRPSGGRVFGRSEAVAHYIAEHVCPHHAHRSWMTKFEVHDDGSDESIARELLAPHVEAGNLSMFELEEHVAAYLRPADAAAHEAHLHSHFKVKVPS